MSFDAQTTWNVWREILRDGNLQVMLRSQEFDSRAIETPFNDEELTIARCYQNSFKDAEWFVTSYQFRLVSAFINAIELGAPLTHRVLRAHGHDIRDMAKNFFDKTGWYDDGPFVYRLAGKILDWLTTISAHEDIPGLLAVTRLEAAAVKMLRDAAYIDRDVWSQEPLSRAELFIALDQGKTLEWTGAARIVDVDYDITPLFSANREEEKPNALEKQIGYFAVYLPSLTQKHRFARIHPKDFEFAKAVSSRSATKSLIMENIDRAIKFAKIHAVQTSIDRS